MQNSEAFTGSLLGSKLGGLEKRTEALESTTLALAARLAVLEGVGQGGDAACDPVCDPPAIILEPEREPISEGAAAAPLEMPETAVQAAVEPIAEEPALFQSHEPELAAVPTPSRSLPLAIRLALEAQAGPFDVVSPVPDDKDAAPPVGPALLAQKTRSLEAGQPNMLVQSEQTGPAASRPSIESRIGLYWLSKLGIGFLVIGVALLIMYSFGNFGPVAKVATGFIISAALMALGEYMERENNMPWYARLIEGGAWALGYFTTYAMYHVESVKIINNPVIDLVLLLAVACLAVYHATCKRSEIMAIFAVSLGFVTLGLSHVTLFSGVASAVLVALSVFLSVRQSWSKLYLYSVFASYGALLYCGSLEHSFNLSAVENFRTVAMLLCPGLIGFSLMPFFFRVGHPACPSACKGVGKDDESARQTIGLGIITNLIAFCSLFLSHAYRELGTDASFYNIAVGAWFFIVAHLYDRKGFSFLSSLCSFWALTISTFYFSGAALGERTWPWLALETVFVVWIGLRHKLKTFSWFGTILGLSLVFGNLFIIASPKVISLFGLTVPFVALSVSSALAALLGSAFLQRRQSLAASSLHSDRKTNFFIFWHEALVLSLLLPLPLICVAYEKLGCLSEDLQTPFLTLAWSVLAGVVLCTGIKLRSRYISGVAILLSLWVALPVCAYWHFSWAVSAPGAASIFAAAFLFRHFKLRYAYPVDEIPSSTALVVCRSSGDDALFGTRLFRTQYLIAFCLAAMLPLSASLDTQATIIYWSVQAVVGLLLGMQIRDSFVRLLTAVLLPVAAIAAFNSPIDWPFALPVLSALWLAWALYRVVDWFAVDGAEVAPGMDVADASNIDQNVKILVYHGWPASVGITRGEHDVRHIYSVLASTVLCACIAVQMQGAAQAIAWSCQGFVLLLSGLAFKDRVLRYSAIGASALLILHLVPGTCPYSVVLPVVFVFFAIWQIYRLAFRAADEHEIDCRHFYSIAAGGLLAACFGHRILTAWISSGWAAEAVILLLAGVLLRDRVLRMTSLAVSLSLVFRLMLAPLQLEQVLPAVVALYAGWGFYRPNEFFGLDGWERAFRHIYSIAGGLLLSLGLAVEMHNTWVSCAWAVQGVITLLVGFIYREKVLRMHGLCLFGALTVRLFFIDLAAAPTVYRIFAFIVTGCILLLSAYGYNWFARRFNGEEGLSIAPAEGPEMQEGCA